METWLNINLSCTVLWFLFSLFKTKRPGVNNLADLIVIITAWVMVTSWPIYALVAIWQ